MMNKTKDMKKKVKITKGMRFGFVTQPSKFFHTLYLQYKIFIYHALGKQDTTVLYVPSDQRC